MRYRYFYDNQGTIVANSTYKKICYATGMNDSIGYIDTDQNIDITQYRVDLTTKTLVEIANT